jgi:hypothetical protein
MGHSRPRVLNTQIILKADKLPLKKVIHYLQKNIIIFGLTIIILRFNWSLEVNE